MASNYTEVENRTASSWWRDPSLRRNIRCICLLYLGSFSIGYDGSYLNGLQALPYWQDFFDHPTGYRLSIIGSMPYFTALGASPFFGMIQDRLGRKNALWLASSLMFAAGFITAFSTGTGMLLAGRALAGPGMLFGLSSSNLLITELVHPRLRAVASSLLLAWFYVGSIASAWTSFGVIAGGWESDWSWRLPTLLQVVGPAILFCGVFFIPESPRWLIARGRTEQAHTILASQHANNDMTDPLVLFELDEITAAIDRDRDQKNPLRQMFLSKNRDRLIIVSVCAFGCQMNGVGIFSYYLTPVLNNVGVDSALQQTAINGCLSIWNLIWAVTASTLCDKVGRRPLWLVSTGGMLISFICLIGTSAGFAEKGSKASGLASVAFIFLAFAFYDIAWTSLVYMYSTEILPYSLRAHGMAYSQFVQIAGILFGSWVNPIGLENGGWKFYFLYCGLLAAILAVIYCKFPETKGLSLEGVAAVFDDDSAQSPVNLMAENVELKIDDKDTNVTEVKPVLHRQ